MTDDQFDRAHRGFCRRRPVRPFLIEFASGAQVLVGHPEVVRNEEQLYMMRCRDGSYVVFGAEGVSRILDVPASTA